MAKKCLWVPQNWFFFKKIFLAKIFLENLSKWTKNTHPEVFSGVKFNSKTFLFSSLWPKNASKCLKIEFFGKLVNLGQTLTCRDSMGLQLIGLRDPSHLIIYQYVPHMSYAAIRKFLRGYHNHRMCNSVPSYTFNVTELAGSGSVVACFMSISSAQCEYIDCYCWFISTQTKSAQDTSSQLRLRDKKRYLLS